VPIKSPDPAEIARIGRRLGLELSPAEAAAYLEMMAGILDAYGIVDELPDFTPAPVYPRSRGAPPAAGENRLGAWAWKVEIEGRPEGPLAGKRIAVKDSIAVAGVPMRAGTGFLGGCVPSVDATVVTRVLDAGGTIVGKTNCEYLTLSGSSHTSLPAPVRNPFRPNYAAGGSSSGSAVAIAIGEADLGIGTDQGGSIRIPASWCGVVGMKPTFGLVPYTGVMPLEWTLDHAGPMSATVRDNALLLEVLAGPDGLDARQSGHPAAKYAEGIEAGGGGLRIGVVAEAFGTPVSEPPSDAIVLRSADRLRAMGARVDEVSLPIHRIARSIFTPTMAEGVLDTVLVHNGAGMSHAGVFDAAVTDAVARWREHAAELPPTVKVIALAARYMSDTYGGRFYGKSQNLIRRMRAEYDRALAEFDLLLMPSTPHKATELPPPGAGPGVVWSSALTMNVNTAPFCATGHPAISVPCGDLDGLPIGAMLVGRHYAESTVYRAAFALEQSLRQERGGMPRFDASRCQ
jgi:amidase